MVSKKKAKKIKWATFLGLLTLLLVGTASWALYGIFNDGIGLLLSRIGIENTFAQGGIVVAIVLIFLLLLGTGLVKAITKVVNG